MTLPLRWVSASRVFVDDKVVDETSSLLSFPTREQAADLEERAREEVEANGIPSLVASGYSRDASAVRVEFAVVAEHLAPVVPSPSFSLRALSESQRASILYTVSQWTLMTGKVRTQIRKGRVEAGDPYRARTLYPVPDGEPASFVAVLGRECEAQRIVLPVAWATSKQAHEGAGRYVESVRWQPDGARVWSVVPTSVAPDVAADDPYPMREDGTYIDELWAGRLEIGSRFAALRAMAEYTVSNVLRSGGWGCE